MPRGFLGLRDKNRPIRPIPGRYLMTPPKLPGDAPGLDLAHPVEERVLPLGRHKLRTAVLHRGQCRSGKRPGIAIPLVGQPRLDDRTRSVNGRRTDFPTRSANRRSLGWTATPVSPSIVSGRVVATTINRPGISATG